MVNAHADNTEIQMRKGMLEFCTLLAISEQARYASEILERLRQAELIVVEGTLYPLLSRLRREELLKYEWVESTSGPPRKYYKLTPQGRQTLKQLLGTWKQLSTSISSFVSAYADNN